MPLARKRTIRNCLIGAGRPARQTRDHPGDAASARPMIPNPSRSCPNRGLPSQHCARCGARKSVIDLKIVEDIPDARSGMPAKGIPSGIVLPGRKYRPRLRIRVAASCIEEH